MPNLICRGLSFAYDGAGSEKDIFSNLDLVLDTEWRAALVGANGRGKTTLLRLLAGELEPDRGAIERPVSTLLYTDRIQNEGLTAWESAREMAGPFRRWERRIEHLLSQGDDASLAEYGELESTYRSRGGYKIDVYLKTELTALAVPESVWSRSLTSLSGGEQTRTLLAGLFAAGADYPLIDEPTNHLDLEGRQILARYLAEKPGFLLVSHDRAFLDACIDHVIALNPDTVETQRASFSHWRQTHAERLAEQARSNELLRKDIRRLETAAAARRAGADAREADKTAGGRRRLPSERGGDSGFVGARAARQMKRALAVERRVGQAAEERRASLTDVEKVYPLKLLLPETPAPLHAPLVRTRDFQVRRTANLFRPVSFELPAGERLALKGPNGCGKSSLLDLLHSAAMGEPVTGSKGLSCAGSLQVASRIVVSRAWQIPRWRSGLLRERLEAGSLDESYFRQIMAALGVRGAVLDGSIEHLSQGQQKKIELARSLMTPAHLYIWDEPLNYLDVDARERIEAALLDAALLEAGASFIFVEHDARFVDRLATSEVTLVPAEEAPNG